MNDLLDDEQYCFTVYVHTKLRAPNHTPELFSVPLVYVITS